MQDDEKTPPPADDAVPENPTEEQAEAATPESPAGEAAVPETPPAAPPAPLEPQPPPHPVAFGAPTLKSDNWRDAITSFIWRYVASMFLEQKDGTDIWAVSLGRVSTVFLLMQSMWTWHFDKDLLPGQREVLYVMIGYTFGSKTLTTVRDLIATTKEHK